MLAELKFFESGATLFLVIGLALFAAAILPRFLQKQALSVPILLVAFGYFVFSLPLGIDFPSLDENVEHCRVLTELVVIISLMGAGLKIDRPMGLTRWLGTWRLIGITMVVTIGAVALGGWAIGLVPATALLLGAVLAPTDPVLASEIQVGPPGKTDNSEEMVSSGEDSSENLGDDPDDERDEMRFSLTSEAGLNDALAFPFVYAAVALASIGGIDGWMGNWILVDVLYRIIVGIVCGVFLGKLLGRLILSIPGETKTARALLGPCALAATLILYGATEMVEGYGFLAVFIGALWMRDSCRSHSHHDSLFHFSEMSERLLSALFLIALGGSLAGGILDALNWQLAALGLALIFVIRPLAGILGFIGHTQSPWRERLAISFFGVRGIGSFFYLAYALQQTDFAGSEQLWAVVGFTVAVSILVHGILATPILEKLKGSS